MLLIGKNLGLKLHERMDVTCVLGANALVREHDPTVFVRHLLGFLVQLLLFGWENLRNR